MISAVLNSPILWGVAASAATDLLTRMALKRLPLLEGMPLTGASVSIINLVILAKTGSYSGSLPGFIYGIALQLNGLKENYAAMTAIKKTIAFLKEEETKTNVALKKDEEELIKTQKEIAEGEMELKRQQDLIFTLQDAIAQLENEKKTT